MSEAKTYNPLDRRHLGESIVGALLDTEIIQLKGLHKFFGAGIYAIYYTGSNQLYAPLAKPNQGRATHPIYVGKAVPKGGRKGVQDSSIASTALYSRLGEHADSIRACGDFKIEDFTCRYLAVEDIWIGLGESLLIQTFRPVWNHVVDGFGNHDPGGGRYEGRKPLWDELHPGRAWAARCKKPPKLSFKEIVAAVEEALGKLPVSDE